MKWRWREAKRAMMGMLASREPGNGHDTHVGEGGGSVGEKGIKSRDDDSCGKGLDLINVTARVGAVRGVSLIEARGSKPVVSACQISEPHVSQRARIEVIDWIDAGICTTDD